VKMIGGPTEPTGPGVWALPAVVTRVLAMTGEAVGEGRQLALAEYRPRRGAWLSHTTPLQAIFAFAILRIGVGGSLSGVEAGDDAGWG
jgi:hypothetical protein